MVGYRTVKVREDVYVRLARLANSSGKSMSDLIEELLNNHEGRVGGNSIVEGLNEVRAMLRDCLDRFGVRETKPVEIKPRQNETVPELKNGVSVDSAFGNNPWVRILRVGMDPKTRETYSRCLVEIFRRGTCLKGDSTR
ncbi:MAG: ribbon-helix-helix protein, CopG family [Vulcanisaeta sp.]|jgi:predicted CopG family antitoxin|nr:ribbon-helix-helix protein, CopG family [Vulcanisaeta sp.]